jgi:hypothetical protein
VTAPELADCYVPIPLRWRHVIAGDILLGQSGVLFAVTASRPHVDPRGHITGQWALTVGVGPDARPFIGDPDEPARVLTGVPERDALTVLRDELSARVVERRIAESRAVK